MNKLIYSAILLATISIFSACYKDDAEDTIKSANTSSFVITTDTGTTSITADSA